MIGLALRRLAQGVPTLLVVATVSFFLMRLAPGGPFDLERPLAPAAMENLRRVYGLDRSLPEQYLGYLAALLRGDLGPSFSHRDLSVADLFARGLPVSLTLGSLALLLALALGIGLGSLAALRRGSLADRLVGGLAALSLSVPSFVAAPLLQIVFGLGLRLLPVGGWEGGAPRNLVLPVLTLALPQIGAIARLTRASLAETLRAQPVRTQRAMGLPPGRILRHALRGALLPVVALLGPLAAGLLTGSVVVETVFGLPGIGRYFVEGALNRDYTLVMGTVLLVAALVILFNILADLAAALLDPRLRPDA
ncbi:MULTISPECIES: ABC transporter permease subunit [Methylobacterium]|uniref:Oligopeptide transport system permease protein OppB n=1 Tax=Methylobacterium jeotgali TaxID=381630 RepID=A0ABQ4SR05_9HYPH|nr:MULTISPECIES: ABC transporter permease subunit [Methylobacterium]PIU07862.1 MAG: ABC transporter [Methylobacterium sp. CG09_land_8_20_14_0_10_71_15]PIU11061.1 MAG: ABC transporter [Methylobacterium sp. CG08_land_8_20_14_0_20_71_15]GBU16022.1 oligopeptide ABC transporter permease [Methylobacterium sp.]GJE05654.1 Oligopeptide transport system permease protein OppB [Methylobacterium jeotgali]